MNRAERRRLAKDDERRLVRGIDPESRDPELTAAMVRQLYSQIKTAERTKIIDPVVQLLHSKVDATVRDLSDIPIACKKGCSHCCYIWVSVTAPELLYIAKIIKRQSVPIIDKVKAAHEATKDYDFDIRDKHPHACPMLEGDICSIYEFRPKACRMASSADASICARSYHNLSNEDIPTPMIYMLSRTVYATALAIALKQAQLPYCAYEFNAGIARALERDDAEKAWLSGEDIFSDVRREPGDIFSKQPVQMMYQYVFGN